MCNVCNEVYIYWSVYGQMCVLYCIWTRMFMCVNGVYMCTTKI